MAYDIINKLKIKNAKNAFTLLVIIALLIIIVTQFFFSFIFQTPLFIPIPRENLKGIIALFGSLFLLPLIYFYLHINIQDCFKDYIYLKYNGFRIYFNWGFSISLLALLLVNIFICYKSSTIYIVGNSSDALAFFVNSFNEQNILDRKFTKVVQINDDWSRYDTDEKFTKAVNYLNSRKNRYKNFQKFIKRNYPDSIYEIFSSKNDSSNYNDYNKIVNEYIGSLNRKECLVDIIELDCIWLQSFINEGYLYRLNKFTDFESVGVEGAFYQHSLLYARSKELGGIYAITHFVDVGMFYYNKEILGKDINFNTFNLEDIIIELRKAIKGKEHEVKGFVFPCNKYEGLNCSFIDLLSLNGYRITNDDYSIKSTFDRDPIVINTIRFLHNAIHEDGIIPISTLSFKEDHCRDVFSDKHSMFLRNWPYVWLNWYKESDLDRDLIDIVKNENLNTIMGGWYFAISDKSKHKRKAWEFIKFATSKEMQTELYLSINNKRFPSRKDLDSGNIDALGKKLNEYQEFRKIIERAQTRPIHKNYRAFSQSLQEALYESLSEPDFNEEQLKENLKKAQDYIRIE